MTWTVANMDDASVRRAPAMRAGEESTATRNCVTRGAMSMDSARMVPAFASAAGTASTAPSKDAPLGEYLHISCPSWHSPN